MTRMTVPAGLRARTAFLAGAALLLLALAPPPARGARNAALDLNAGIRIPFDDDNRDRFGAGFVAGIGLPTRIAGSSWMILDLGLVRTAGRDTRFDPTFHMADTELWMVPITLGVRFNTAPGQDDRRSRLYMGFGLQSWLSWYDRPGVPARFEPAFGVMAEWRHELDIASGHALFVRQRIQFTTTQEYESLVQGIGFGGTTLELGWSRRLGREPGHPEHSRTD